MRSLEIPFLTFSVMSLGGVYALDLRHLVIRAEIQN